jgi:DNA polymerase III subunit gamma/tau
MSEALTLKYRPRSWSDLIGQRSVQVFLQQMVRKGEVPSAIIFEGSRGVGKTTSARVLAAALNCEDGTGPCTKCKSCLSVYDGTSMAMLEIDAASNGLVDDIRNLREQLMYSVGSQKRILVLDEVHSMQKAAFNALLKTLEEPPPDTYFLLLTTEPAKIPDTIQSRCMSFNFVRIAIKDIISRLQYICDSEGFDIDPSLLAVLAERSNGGMRDAVMTLDQVARSGVKTIDEYAEIVGDLDFAPAMISKMVSADLPGLFGAVGEQLSRTGDPQSVVTQIISAFRDILVLKSGGEIPGRQGEFLESRKRLAALLDQDKTFNALRVLWDLKTKVRLGEDARTLVELACVMVTDAISKGSVAPKQVSAPQASKRLSLDEMRRVCG